MKIKLLIFLILINIFLFLIYINIKDIKNIEIDFKTTKALEFENSDKDLVYWKKINKDTVAILKFRDKSIPIVQKDNNMYYLNRNIYLEQDRYGVPYLDYQNNIDDTNLIIYGHSSNKKNLVFTEFKDSLKKLGEIISLETEIGKNNFEIFSIIEIDEDNQDKFMNWYQFNIDDLNIYAKKLYENSSNFNIVSLENKKILTIITCNLDKVNSRYIITAVSK